MPFGVWLTGYNLLGVLLAYGLFVRWLRPVVLDEPIQVEPALVVQVEQRLDPNTADWADLAQLPGIGEALAKRIVAYRPEHQPLRLTDEPATVFWRAEDLTQVQGIGPKLLDRIRPQLRFPADPDAAPAAQTKEPTPTPSLDP